MHASTYGARENQWDSGKEIQGIETLNDQGAANHLEAMLVARLNYYVHLAIID